MQELTLKYGCNPNQKPARVFMEDGSALPFQVLNGRPGYINLLDALNGWQLVSELREMSGLPAAASFKHVSPAGAALGLPVNDTERRMYHLTPEQNLSPLACAYAKARGADRMSSFGDFIALSDACDMETASLIKSEISDGVIAPGYAPEALALLSAKKNGNYTVIQIDPSYQLEELERKQVYGVMFEQGHNDVKITDELLNNIVTAAKTLPESAKRDLLVSLITLKYTQSNSVCYVYRGQAIGVGAGQQSRIHCTRLAGNKADNFLLRQHDKVLNLPFLPEVKRQDRDNAIDLYIGEEAADVLSDGKWQALFVKRPEAFLPDEKKEHLKKYSGLALGSDAFFPFGDNIERARRSGVTYVVQPGGSVRDDNVIKACNAHRMVMCFTGTRLFTH